VRAFDAASTLPKKSCVAIGPMPPSTPTVRAAPSHDLQIVLIRKERGRSAGVDEDDVLAAFETPLTDEADEARRRFAGVDGVEQDRFVRGEQAHRLDHFRRRQRIAGADPVIERDDGGLLDGLFEVQQRRRLDGELVDIAFLLRARSAHVDAGERDVRVLAPSRPTSRPACVPALPLATTM
jgi:hypothetical protein